MTTIDLIIEGLNLGQDVLASVTELLNSRSVAFKLCTVYIFQIVLPLLLISSYPLPIFTMHHIQLCKCGGLWTFVFPPDIQNAKAS